MLPLLLLVAAVAAAQTNYNESAVVDYTLPDPLVTRQGARVTKASQWPARRAEILDLFQSQVYGRSAARPAKIEFEIARQDAEALGGKAVRKEVTVWLTPDRKGPSMSVLVYTPKGAGPFPVFLGLNFNGNQAVHADPGIAISKNWMRPARDGSVENNRANEKSRGTEASRWQIDYVLSRGYAVASVYYGDIFPDHKDGLGDSIIPRLYRPGQTAQAPDDWNAIGAWAWGLSRALDYIEKDPSLDAKRVAVHGHSRLGKTSLWAGAMDERFALVISNDSGEGGAALARRNFGETVERINTAFPHWFNANFKRYNKDVAGLPVDQHMLIALIAPRPVYIASAQEDLWADPRGEFLGGKGADPVYRLLGTDGLAASDSPPLHQPVMSRIGYHVRAGKHDVTKYDWEQFVAFADKHMKR
ncbi:MAG: acetylxylan esterase [Bryobacteraceae bacterium]